MSCYFCTGCGRLFEYAKHDRLQKISYCNPTGKPQAMLRAQLTPWFTTSKNPPYRTGWYEIKNIGCERVYWDGKKWKSQWKSNFRWPSEFRWRGLMPRNNVD